jgi:hypothetical protein
MYGSADRWQTFYNQVAAGTNTISRQTFSPGQTAVPGNPTYFIRTTTNGSATQTATDYYQRVEDVSTFAGQTVTLSFWAQASNSGTIAIYIDQNFGSGGSTTVEATPTASAANFTTTWAKYTATFTLPSISGKTVGAGNYVGFRIRNFTSLVSGTFDLAQVQLELGSVATPFSRAGGTIQGELAACQRYYWQVALGSALMLGSSFYFTSTQAEAFIQYPVTMRTTPVLIATSGANYYRTLYNGGLDAFDSLTINAANNQNTRVYNNTEVSGAAGSAGVFFTNNASSSVAFNAEL